MVQGPFVKGRGTQAEIPKKNKGVQTMPVEVGEEIKWNEERKLEERMEEERARMEWKLIIVELLSISMS